MELRPPPPPRWTQWVPMLYLAFGVVWILASDSVVQWLFAGSPHTLAVASTLKGFAFVFLTALVLALWWRADQRYNATLLQSAEARASFANERMAWMSRHANDVILLLDEDGRILDCNDRAEGLYGYSRAELLGMTALDLRPGHEHDAAGTQFGRVMAQGQLLFEALHQRKDGSVVPVEVSSTSVEFEGRRYVQSIVRDQTELAAARRRIERQRDLYDLLSRCNHVVARVQDRRSLYASVVRLAVEHGRFRFAWIAEARPDGSVDKVAAFGEDGGYVEQLQVSARADEPTGLGPTGRALRECATIVTNRFLTDPVTAPWHELARQVGIGSCASLGIPLRAGVGAALMVYASEPEFFDADIVATLEEIAAEIGFGLEALETRRELDESRHLLQTVIDASTAPIFAFDADGRALLMNAAGAAVLGRPREQLIGQTRTEVYGPKVAAGHQATDARILETGEPLAIEETVGEGHQQRVFLSVKFPLSDLHGRRYAVGGVSTDITELRRAQQEVWETNAGLERTVAERTQQLTVARDRAEQADRAKTAFLSTVSHELRTPLNSIIGFTDIVLQELSGPLNKEQLKQLSIVHDSARMLLDLINEILDLSRIEAGRLQFNVETFDLRDLLERRVQALRSQSDAKGLLLVCSVDGSVGTMRSDARRVAQIVTNLLSNAVKFTASGSVTLEARVDGPSAIIEVIDTGPGIGPEDMANLFKPFMQGGEAQRRHREGTGLGLVISRHLARALGGDITVSSEPGRGSVFTATLPLDLPAEPSSTSDSGLFRKIAPSEPTEAAPGPAGLSG